MKPIEKQSITVFLGLVLVLLLSQCVQKEYYRYPHYITDCLSVDSLHFVKIGKIPLTLSQNDRIYHRELDNYPYVCKLWGIRFIEKGQNENIPTLIHHPNKAKTDYLNSIGDNGYAGRRIMPEQACGIWYPVSSISIKCDQDFSKSYPAGRELYELFVVSFRDNIGYIRGGYKGDHPSSTSILACDYAKLQAALVADRFWDFYLIEPPIALAEKNATFTVKVSFLNGVTLQDSYTVTFPTVEQLANPA